MRSFLRYVSLALALCVGCDDGPAPNDSSPESRIPSGYYTAEGGFVADGAGDASAPATMSSDAATGITTGDGGVAGDAGSSTDTDAGTLAPTNDCPMDACGPMPSTTPVCFDGDAAGVECSAYFGRCTWQFVCGP